MTWQTSSPVPPIMSQNGSIAVPDKLTETPTDFIRKTMLMALVRSTRSVRFSSTSISCNLENGSSFSVESSSLSPDMAPSTSSIPICPALNSSLYCFIFRIGGCPSGAMSSKSIFSSTIGRAQKAEVSISMMNMLRVAFGQLIGCSTMNSIIFGGGWLGFFKSNNMVKFGTITIVRM